MKSIISIILIIAAISFFVFFTRPTWSELKVNREEVQSLNVAQDNAKKLKSKIDSLLKTKNAITESDFEKIKKMVPDNVENIKLIIYFDNILQSMILENGTQDIYKRVNGSDISDLAIENPQMSKSDLILDGDFDTSNVGVADFSFTVSLTYRDFISFLRRLENSTRIFDINSISFSAPQSKTANPDEIIYSVNLKLTTYWLKSK